MRVPPLPIESLDKSDELLGQDLLDWWIAGVLEANEIDPYTAPLEIQESVVRETMKLDSDNAEIIALEKAIIKAASFEYAKAGALLRGFMGNGSYFMKMQETISNLDEAAKCGLKVLNAAKLGHEKTHGTEVEKETKRRQYLDLIDEVRRSTPDASDNKVYKKASALSAERFNLAKPISYKTFSRAEKGK